jgi:hypothetical protein
MVLAILSWVPIKVSMYYLHASFSANVNDLSVHLPFLNHDVNYLHMHSCYDLLCMLPNTWTL